MTKPKMPAEICLERFGGLTKWANAYSPPKQLSTVQRWIESGMVPSRQQRPTLDAARRAKVRLTEKDLIPTTEALQALDAAYAA